MCTKCETNDHTWEPVGTLTDGTPINRCRCCKALDQETLQPAWLPIRHARADGSRVVGASAHWPDFIHVTHFADGVWWCHRDDGPPSPWTPTHFAPLPATLAPVALTEAAPAENASRPATEPSFELGAGVAARSPGAAETASEHSVGHDH